MVSTHFPSPTGHTSSCRDGQPILTAARVFVLGLLTLLWPLCRPATAETAGGAPQRDPRMDAPLLEAAEAGDAAQVKTLLDKGADPKVCNRLGWPASTLAACRGYTEVVRLLYERDHDTADQNAPGRWTPLIEATIHNHLETVRFLLACHLMPQTGNDQGLTAENYARRGGYRDIVAAVREAWGEPPETDTDAGGDSPLAVAATAGDTAALARLLDGGGSVEERNALGQTLLICAVKGDKAEAVRLLLARHADPNDLSAYGSSALDFAAGAGYADIIKMLLDAGADPNGFRGYDGMGDNRSPVFQAFRSGRVDLVKLLLAHGARLNETNNVGDTALIQAARWPHADVLAFLVEQGQSVNAANRYGYTALMYAATNGCEDNIRLLLAKGADIHAKTKNRDPDRHTGEPFGALEAATLNGEPYALEILMDAGATPANPGEKLTEELLSAIGEKDYERAQAALRKGASANDAGAGNRRPLLVAVLVGDPGVVQLLLKAGADVNGAPEDGPVYTPLHYALEREGAVKDPRAKEKYARIADILRQAHATR